MILVADSGSTKTDWILVAPGEPDLAFKTAGINPFFISDKEMVKLINKQESLMAQAENVKEIYFFGAGCSSPDKREAVSNVLSQLFKQAYVSVDSDLLGSAYATCGNETGLCCIMGTGSNITYFDGENIYEGKHGLGYILGDEGSGSYFGKKLVTDYLYGRMPEAESNLFAKKYAINKETVIGHVYHKPGANFYLASFAAFLAEIKSGDYGRNLVRQGLTEFVTTNIQGYPTYKRLKCHFVGSVAWHLKEELHEICKEQSVEVGKIMKHPIHDLLNFLLKRN
ncbi:N-acetylglucosamine kinase [Mucilaginibacter arboris]|uniref:N-acetylglucosamine kinase n=1 Tax=Mucilaginibacter arboris TaxID=2682090 RepID=A0A7K1SXS9_9SPHI|nr:N-acetylglucosamine kinase [Mucilaginibacter arboris]MVN21820.1 N-acetylglucosamine kinase [Mucilaginibacter arboris]